MSGCFIVVEGLEGAGKSSVILSIKNYLEQSLSTKVLLVREPGGTQLGEEIRERIKADLKGEALHPEAELFLLYAARVQLLQQVIFPALAAGTWVISDRFELSSYAYQGYGRGLGEHLIDLLSQAALKGFQPDLTFFLDISPEQGLDRVKKRGKLDRLEKESSDFFERVYQGYQQKLIELSKLARIDASQPLERVQQAVIEHLAFFVKTHGC